MRFHARPKFSFAGNYFCGRGKKAPPMTRSCLEEFYDRKMSLKISLSDG